MLLKQNFTFSTCALLIICTLIKRCYQQTTTTIKNFNKELPFCIQNHAMSNTLQTFWHDANADCELESKRLIELYDQLLDRINDLEDQCTAQLKHQMRKKLIQVISTQLEESFVAHSIEDKTELKENLKELQLIDKKVAQIIWQRAINEVYLFVQPEEIINEIVLLEDEETKIVAFQSLLSKCLSLNADHSETIVPRLTYYITALFKSKSNSLSISFVISLEKLYHRLPKALRLLYDVSKENIGLLNYQYFEYLYAPRDNLLNAERRLALTWIAATNSTPIDAYMSVKFNDKGLVAFGSPYGASLKYLYAEVENQWPYFSINSAFKSSQWWQILWPHESGLVNGPEYIKLQNEETKDLLCASTEVYDEKRRYVIMLNATENIKNPACFWSAKIFSIVDLLFDF